MGMETTLKLKHRDQMIILDTFNIENIEKTILKHLIDGGFSHKEICLLTGHVPRTLFRKLDKYGIVYMRQLVRHKRMIEELEKSGYEVKPKKTK